MTPRIETRNQRDRDSSQAYLTLSEVIGHTDILVSEGRVREVEENGVVRYEAVG